MSHSISGGDCMPYSGCAKYRKPASPAVTSAEPSHSRRPTLNPNQVASTATRNTSSVVSTGWTSDSRPRCRAVAWSRNDTIIRAKPSSQTGLRRACKIRLSRSVALSGAFSTPMR